jgi:hypothetical protein
MIQPILPVSSRLRRGALSRFEAWILGLVFWFIIGCAVSWVAR